MSSRFRLPDTSIEVVPHDPRWAEAFDAAKAEILKAISAVTVEHMGSTSVAGISAKPTIDVLVTYAPGSDLDGLIDRLEEAGFEHRPGSFAEETPPHLFFRRVGPDLKRSHHLHVLEEGTARAFEYLLFRDYLRAHTEARSAYETEKMRLIRAEKTRGEYTAEKEGIVHRLLADARRWDAERSRRAV